MVDIRERGRKLALWSAAMDQNPVITRTFPDALALTDPRLSFRVSRNNN